MFGFQASGAAPIVNGEVVPEPSTIATAIRIGNPASWTKAVDARDESGGLIRAVTDREILAAYRLLARSVGVFVELGSAASVAGLLQTAAAGDLPARLDGGLHGHRPRPEGPGVGDRHRAVAGHHPGRAPWPRRRRSTWRSVRSVPPVLTVLAATATSACCSSPSWSCSAATGSS